jgi:hypothetical protein
VLLKIGSTSKPRFFAHGIVAEQARTAHLLLHTNIFTVILCLSTMFSLRQYFDPIPKRSIMCEA